MKAISEYLNESFVVESDLDNIILMNLDELSDNDVIEDMRDYVANNVDPAEVLRIWNLLKEKLGRNTKAWIVPPTRDYENYHKNCEKWAMSTAKKFKLTKQSQVDILVGIAWMINGI